MIKFLGHIGTLTSPSSHPDALTPRMNPNACFQSKILPAGGTKRGRGCLWKRNLKEGQLIQGSRDRDLWMFSLPAPTSKGHLDSRPGTKCSLPSYYDYKSIMATSKETKTKKRPRKERIGKRKRKRERKGEKREGEALGDFQNNLRSLRCFLFKKKMKKE